MTATLVQLSDTHLTAGGGAVHGRDPAGALAATVAGVVAALDRCGTSPGLVVLSGDVTDDGSAGGCRAAARLLAPLGDVAVLAVAGNHDDGPELAAVFGGAAERAVGGWRVLGVHSRLAGKVEGAVDPGAVLARIDAGPPAQPVALVVHHPPIGVSTHPWFALGGAEALLDGLRCRPQVRLVLSGHIHEPFERYYGSLSLLGGPSTLYGLRHRGERWSADDDVPVGARLVHLEPDGSWRSQLVRA